MKRIARSLAASLTLASLSFGLAGCSEPETIPPTPGAASKGAPAVGENKEALAPAPAPEGVDVPPAAPVATPSDETTTPPAETPPADEPK